MIKFFIRLFFLIRFFPLLLQSKESLLLEIKALRQQIKILRRNMPRLKLKKSNRVFWVMLKNYWSDWRSALLLFKPETIVDWHRQGFRLFWRLRSRQNNDESARERKREIRSLIIKLAMDNRRCSSGSSIVFLSLPMKNASSSILMSPFIPMPSG